MDYIRAVAEEGHPPIFGQALIDRRLLDLFVHAYPGHATDAQITPERIDYRNLLSYESIQFPLYYVLMAPVYRVLDSNLAVDLMTLRYINVVLTGLVFLVAAAVTGAVFPAHRTLGAMATLALMLPPGVTIRGSQLTNEVLTELLIAILLYTLIRFEQRATPSPAFVEGALAGLALMAKVTAVAMVPALALAWWTRPGRIRARLLPGSAGFLLVCLPWLIWSGIVYHFPLPWVTRHYSGRMIFDITLAIPQSLSDKLELAKNLAFFYWTPLEWRTVGAGWNALVVLVVITGTALLAAAVANGAITVVVGRVGPEWRAIAISIVSLLALAAGWLFLVVWLDRVYQSDARELYQFVAPLAVVLTALLIRLPRWMAAAGITAWVAVMIVSNYAFFAAGVCIYLQCL